MKKYLWSTAAIILMALASCQESSEFTEEQKAVIEKEVKAQSDGQVSTVNNLDVSGWSENLSKDEFISINSGVTCFSDRSVFMDSLKYWFSLRDKLTFNSLEVRVTPLTQDLALMTDKGNFDILMKSGEKLNLNFLVTFVWKKEQSGWKIIHFHETWAMPD